MMPNYVQYVRGTSLVAPAEDGLNPVYVPITERGVNPSWRSKDSGLKFVRGCGLKELNRCQVRAAVLSHAYGMLKGKTR
jgi:hypothetical protein